MGTREHGVGLHRRMGPVADLALSWGEILPCKPVQPKALTLSSKITSNVAITSAVITTAGNRARVG